MTVKDCPSTYCGGGICGDPSTCCRDCHLLKQCLSNEKACNYMRRIRFIKSKGFIRYSGHLCKVAKRKGEVILCITNEPNDDPTAKWYEEDCLQNEKCTFRSCRRGEHFDCFCLNLKDDEIEYVPTLKALLEWKEPEKGWY